MKIRTTQAEFCTLRSSGEYVIDKENIATCSAEFFIYPTSALSIFSPQIGKSFHPIWSGLFCKTIATKFEAGGIILRAMYEGSFAGEASSGGGSFDSETTIEVSATMREEPIETHQKFADWAGTPEKPKAGVFDEDGIFKGWNAKNDIGAKLQGIRSYLVPSYSGTVSYISRNAPNLGGIGSRGGGQLPAPGGKYQWMMVGRAYQSLADGNYKVSDNYLLSGPNGWNTLVYA